MINKSVLDLTPKRKSILWKYRSDEDDAIIVYGISKERSITLSGEFAVNKDDILKNREEVKKIGKENAGTDSGISVLLENVSARIWELCDGSNTLKEIVQNISDSYHAAFDTVLNDCVEFLKECDQKNIIDMEWRCLE